MSPRSSPTEYTTAIVAAVLAVLVAFGVPLTDVQTGALIMLVGLVAPGVTALVRARHKGEAQVWKETP